MTQELAYKLIRWVLLLAFGTSVSAVWRPLGLSELCLGYLRLWDKEVNELLHLVPS